LQPRFFCCLFQKACYNNTLENQAHFAAKRSIAFLLRGRCIEETKMDEFDQKLEINEQAQEEIVEKIPGRDVYETVSSLVSALLVVVLVFTFFVRLMGVSGPSMIPTLQDGDRLLVVNSLLCGKYEVGDIVIARKESFDDKPIVKRVIATAGQTVDIDFDLGQVYVDGELLDEDYINDYTYREEGTVFPLTVPEGEVFLMGDNRNHSNDSRDSSLGTVDTRLLIGKAVFLVFPGRDYLTEQREFGRIGLLK